MGKIDPFRTGKIHPARNRRLIRAENIVATPVKARASRRRRGRRETVAVFGAANIIADGFSMAASNYSGTKAELDDYRQPRL